MRLKMAQFEKIKVEFPTMKTKMEDKSKKIQLSRIESQTELKYTLCYNVLKLRSRKKNI